MLRLRPCSLVAAIQLLGCDRGIAPTTRPLEVRGLPSCPAKSTYSRPIVVRVDREQTLFEERWSAQARVDAPASSVTLTLPRNRMKLAVRAGLCTATSLGTWDCAAATWLAATTVDVDGRATGASVTLPAFEASCVVGPR